MNESYLLDVLSNREQGVLPDIIRFAAQCSVPFYAGATDLRNFLFDRQLLRSEMVSVPVISIGNLTTGGTGKTPTVAWLAKELSKMGRNPAVVSRGYRSVNGQPNDEAQLLSQILSDVPQVQNRDRFAAAREAIRQSNCDVIVLDDGFQHRKLHRDLDIVLIDALNPWGFGQLLPRGLMRERLHHLQRADSVFITRCDLVESTILDEIKAKIDMHTNAAVLETEFRPVNLVNGRGETLELDEVSHHRICAFCGIGNPSGFRRTLAAVAAPVREGYFRTFPDHHHYSEEDAAELQMWSDEQSAEMLVTTQKDLVKLGEFSVGAIPVWALAIELRLREPGESFQKQLVAVLQSG